MTRFRSESASLPPDRVPELRTPDGEVVQGPPGFLAMWRARSDWRRAQREAELWREHGDDACPDCHGWGRTDQVGGYGTCERCGGSGARLTVWP
jgi:hypothetical protein